MDFKLICRICLEPNKQTFDIYTSYYVKRDTLYMDMLANCTKLKPHKEDGLPKLICKECTRQLKRTYSFNILCEESDKKLRSYIEDRLGCTDNREIKNETVNIDVKSENVTVEFSDEQKVFNILDETIDIKDAIKLEPNFSDDVNDSSWDADDDNLILEKIKVTKIHKEPEIEGGKPKRKRGRNKRVYLDGELPMVPESKLPHQCDICGKFLSTKSNLKAHKICHTDLRPYKCSECSATFRGHSALFQHRKVHTGETPYHCEYCPKKFSRRTGLVNHIRMHTGEKLYSCEICFKNFVQSAQLSIHMKRHKGDKPYLCQDCGKGFPIKADLKVHQRIHNGEKPYSCYLCPKTFATSGNLSIHIRIHKKEIRYNCKECQRGFVTNSAYNVHLKRHKGQRDYHCECGKTFYTSSALKQHKVVHTGEKKYQCKICERKFTQTSHLSRHFKRDHVSRGSNVAVPSSEQYKIIVQDDSKVVFGVLDGPMQKLTQNVNADVKCEGS